MNARRTKLIVDECRKLFESRISVGAVEKYRGGKNLTRKRLCGPTTWKDVLKSASRDVVNWQTKKKQLLYKISTHCKKEELESVGELSKVSSQPVLKRLYLARIGRPDILWSVNKLARSVTYWTGACDKRLVRLISYIHHTSDYRQNCYVGNTAQHCPLGLFLDSGFAGDF